MSPAGSVLHPLLVITSCAQLKCFSAHAQPKQLMDWHLTQFLTTFWMSYLVTLVSIPLVRCRVLFMPIRCMECSLLSLESFSQHTASTPCFDSSSSLNQVFFILVRTSALFLYEDMKTIFSFRPISPNNSSRAPRQCFTKISAAPLVRTLFLSVITSPA